MQYDSTRSDADALIFVKRKTEATERCYDPLQSAATSLRKLASPEETYGEMVKSALGALAEKVENDNLRGPKAMLAAQAQMLHLMFAEALERYAESKDAEGKQLYGAIALKAQGYCRQTVDSIAQLRNPKPLPWDGGLPLPPGVCQP